MRRFSTALAVRVFTGVVGAIGAVALLGATAWWGAPFPGFFLMPNRVVPSAGLPGWARTASGGPLFQHVLLAVDGTPVADAAAGYALARRHPPGAPVAYTFGHGGALAQHRLPLRTFTPLEFAAIFGAYALTGLAYLLLAAVAGERWAGDAGARALTAFGWAGALFSFTGMDLYGAGTLFRLHAAAETVLLAACTHLVLVWPQPLTARQPDLTRLLYGLAAAVVLVYQLVLYDPRGYSVLHNLCQGLMVVPTLVLAVRLALADDGTAAHPPALRRLLYATLLGFVAPGVLLGTSGFTGGDLPVSMAAWVNFVFPLACIAALRGPRLPALVLA